MPRLNFPRFNSQSGIAMPWVMMLVGISTVLIWAAQNKINDNMYVLKRYNEREDLCDLRRYITMSTDCTNTNTATGSCTSGRAVAVKNSKNDEFMSSSGKTVGSFQVQTWCLAGSPTNRYEVIVKPKYYRSGDRDISGNDPNPYDGWSRLMMIDCNLALPTKCDKFVTSW